MLHHRKTLFFTAFGSFSLVLSFSAYNVEELLKKRDIQVSSGDYAKLVLLKLIPLKAGSKLWGSFSETVFPMPIRIPLLEFYVKSFGCEMGEAERSSLEEYASLQDLFTRKLQKGVRLTDFESKLVSPVDGQILAFGKIDESSQFISRVKGFEFSLSSFFGGDYRKYLQSPNSDRESTSLYFCTIYLAPGDYHRFHSCAEWKAESLRHMGGELFSVNPRMLKFLSGIFSLNERVSLIGKWEYGMMSMTFVGATNVGGIELNDFRNEDLKSPADFECAFQKDLKKGDEIGHFRMGSTVVLVFEAPKNFDFLSSDSLGKKIKLGQALSTAINKK